MEDDLYEVLRDFGPDMDEEELDAEAGDWANGYGTDAEVDADALASAGMGTDEDYQPDYSWGGYE